MLERRKVDNNKERKAFLVKLRPLYVTNMRYLEECFGSECVNNKNRIESCQRWFTKRIKGLFDMRYSERLACLGLESLQVRRLKHRLYMCYKIVHSQLTIQNDDFLVFADYPSTRGHCYKLYKGQPHVNAHNSLQIVFVRYGILCHASSVVETSSFNVLSDYWKC